ncbi:MAG TPA: prepilin peptidase [Candidatus Limnocylindrales bacterium]|nr:prepilin peptidase [Candidatus Limnocylindrales bacterium]
MPPYDLFMYALFFTTGLCFGSFLNVIIYRVPRQLSLISPPSRCPSCNHRLGFLELIPLLGYLLLKGRCRHCQVQISPRYPLIELATGLLFVLVYQLFNVTFEGFGYLVLLFILLGVALIDLDHRIVPNTLVAAGLLTGAVMHIPALASYLFFIPPWLLAIRPWSDALLGLLLGGGVMLVIILVSRGGMGAGDLKLMALIGLFVGLRGAAVTMMLAFMLGGLTGITLMMIRKVGRKDAVPFAPFLSLAALMQVVWGEQIWTWYNNLL